MNQTLGFFDQVARVGSLILDALGGAPTTTAFQKHWKPVQDIYKQYLKRVEEIYTLLGSIHDQVADVAVEVGLAANMDEAKEAIKKIESSSLADTFRANDWCDELQRLGEALRPLGQEAGLSEEDQRTWDEFCSALEQREGEVAKLYNDKLYDFRMLVYGDLSLESLKEKVKGISDQLVTQKARFDLLAKQAKATRQRLRLG
jgi:hypothetical protein